jgi:hypothetical protein
MPNWWLQWAERIALVLAEWWMRSGADGASAPPAPDEPVPKAPPPVPEPGSGADDRQR